MAIDELWGLLNIEGEEIMNCKYDCIYDRSFDGQLIRVSYLDKVGVVGLNGIEYWGN